MTKTVRFVVQNGPYMPGELAGFPDAHADRLVAAGVAEESETGAPVANTPGHRGVATRTDPPRTLRRGTIVTKVDTPVGTPEARIGPTATAFATGAGASGNDGNVTTGEGEAGQQGGGVIGGSSSRAQAPEDAPVEGQQPEEQPQGEGRSTRTGKAGGKA